MIASISRLPPSHDCPRLLATRCRVTCFPSHPPQNSAAAGRSLRSGSLQEEQRAASPPAPLSTVDVASVQATVQQVLAAQQQQQQGVQHVDVQRLLTALLQQPQQAVRAEPPVSRGTSQATSVGAGATPRQRRTASPSPGDWDPLYSDEQLLGEEGGKKGDDATPAPDRTAAAAMDVSPVAAIAQERMQALLMQQQQQLLLSVLAQHAPQPPAQQVGWQGPVAVAAEPVAEGGVRKKSGEEGGLRRALREAQQGRGES